MWARLKQHWGDSGWVDATFSAGFLSMSAFLIWPAFALPHDRLGALRLLSLLLLPFSVLGPHWATHLRQRVSLCFVLLWIGALAEFSSSGHARSLFFQGSFFIVAAIVPYQRVRDNEVTHE